MTDLFGLEQQTPRTNDRKEGAALLEVLKALRAHPAMREHRPHRRARQIQHKPHKTARTMSKGVSTLAGMAA